MILADITSRVLFTHLVRLEIIMTTLPMLHPPTSAFPRKGLIYTAVAVGAILVAANITMLAIVAVVGISKMASPVTDITVGLSAVDKACVAVLHNGGVPEDCSRMYRLDIYP